MTTTIVRGLQSSLEAATRVLFEPVDRPSLDFSQPAGEAALVSPNSVSWRVFTESAFAFHRRRHRCYNGTRRAARAHRCVGAYEFPCRSDPAAAQNRVRSHGDDLRCSQYGRGHDSPRSAHARHGRRHNTIGRSLPAPAPSSIPTRQHRGCHPERWSESAAPLAKGLRPRARQPEIRERDVVAEIRTSDGMFAEHFRVKANGVVKIVSLDGDMKQIGKCWAFSPPHFAHVRVRRMRIAPRGLQVQLAPFPAAAALKTTKAWLQAFPVSPC